MAMSPHLTLSRGRGSGAGKRFRSPGGHSRRAAYPAGVAVHRFADRRFTLAAEDPLLHQSGTV